MRSVSRRTCFIAALAALIACGLPAQETRGTISGRVWDPSSAVIPDVTVTATNQATGTRTSGKSNSQGDYLIPYLLPGRYTITAEAPGFKTFSRPGVELRTDDRLQIDIVMQLGQQSEQVTVAAETPLLETRTASVGQVIDRQWLSDLPILHSNPMLLTQLAPGVVNTSRGITWVATSAGANGNHTQYNMGGSTTSTQEISLDGASNTTTSAGAASGRRTVAFIPPADVVSEFKVQVASFDASVGFTTGGSVAVSLKSGTNRFHGNVLYQKTNVGWNANDFFANRTGQPRAPLNTDHEVATGSGPVLLPRLYGGRNRTFFLYGWEREKRSAPFAGAMYTVPTEKQREGDFSDLLKVSSTYQIYDPFSATPVGGRVTRQPFPNNVLPKQLLNPVAQKILEYYPRPRTAGLADSTMNYPHPNLVSVVTMSSHTGRIDHNLSDRHRVFLRAYWGERPATANDHFDNLATGVVSNFANRGALFDDVYTFSPSLFMNLRYSFTRFFFPRLPKSQGMDLSILGLPASLVRQIDPISASFPSITISGLSSIGGNDGNAVYTNTHGLAGQASWAAGAHIVKFGAEYRNYQNNVYNWSGTSPDLAFSINWTRGPFDNSTSSPGGVGQGLASFLLGLPTSGSIARTASYAQASPVTGLFVHDDWRISDRITLNLGLRYEVEGALSERFDRTVRGFDTTTLSALHEPAARNYAQSPIRELPPERFRVQGGLLFAGVSGQPHALYDTPHSNFAPRLGVAVQVAKNTTIRAGYGIYYGFLGQQSGLTVIQTGFSRTTPLVVSLDGGLTFASTLTNLFPSGILEPKGASGGLETNVGQGVSFFNSSPATPYNQIWSLTIQRQLSPDSWFEIGYLGNRGLHLQTQRDFQYFPSEYLSRLPVRDQATVDYWTTNVSNPFYPLLPDTGLAARVVTRDRVVRMANFPQFTSVSMRDNEGRSWYHALVARAGKRYGSTLTLQANYTRSKLMQANSRLNGQTSPLEKVIAGDDRPHNFTFNAIYRFPFGTGGRLATGSRTVNQILGGWQAGVILTLQSGPPLGFGNALLTGTLQDIPLASAERSIDRWFNTEAFNRDTRQQLSYNYRTLSSLFSGVRAPGMNILNATLMKTLSIKERARIELKADAANLFNRPNFGSPNTSPTSAAFGRITSTTTFARIIQLGAKLLW